jgi:hypothetical protein
MAEDISFCERPEKGTMTVREAGKLGGLSLLHKRGKTYFSEIGKKGQAATRSKYPGMASVWGKLGGRPKKEVLFQCMEEQEK